MDGVRHHLLHQNKKIQKAKCILFASEGAPCLLQNEYPEKWPTFWKELLGMLSEGPGVVDMLCRILITIDDDVISLDISR